MINFFNDLQRFVGLVQPLQPMKYIAAYLLAVAGGDANPTEEKVIAILSSVGIEADPKLIKALFEKIKSRSLEEIIAEGKSKIQIVSGGSAPVASTSAPTGTNAPAPKKEEEQAAAAAPLDLGDMFGDF